MLGINVGRGFTLLELLITLAIVAIVTAVAAPSFSDIIERQRVRSAADNLRSSIELARSEAVKRNSPVTVNRIEDNWNKGWKVQDGTTVLQTFPAQPSLTISNTASSIQFNGNGRSSAAADFSLSPDSGNTANAYCVDISLSGRPRTRKGAC